MGERITSMPAASGLTAADVFPVVQGGSNYKATPAQLASYLEGLGVFATAAQGQEADGAVPKNYWPDAGSVNTVVINPSPAQTARVIGLPIWVKISSTNTDVCTLTINSLASKPIKKFGASALVAGDLVAGQLCQLVWDGVNYQIISAVVPTPSLVGTPIKFHSSSYVGADISSSINGTLTVAVSGVTGYLVELDMMGLQPGNVAVALGATVNGTSKYIAPPGFTVNDIVAVGGTVRFYVPAGATTLYISPIFTNLPEVGQCQLTIWEV